MGSVVGVVVGLFGERWVRWIGGVRCDIRWISAAQAGVEVMQRHLEVTFLNRKDVPVTIWGMRVEFYKGQAPERRGAPVPGVLGLPRR